jgi:hypothetical protein
MVGCAAERCGGTIVNPLIAIAIKRSFFIDFPFYHKIGCGRLRGSQIKGVLAFFTVNFPEAFAGGGRTRNRSDAHRFRCPGFPGALSNKS